MQLWYGYYRFEQCVDMPNLGMLTAAEMCIFFERQILRTTLSKRTL